MSFCKVINRNKYRAQYPADGIAHYHPEKRIKGFRYKVKIYLAENYEGEKLYRRRKARFSCAAITLSILAHCMSR